MSKLSRYYEKGLEAVIKYFLNNPYKFLTSLPSSNYLSSVKHIIFDGTYFKRTNCLLLVIDKNGFVLGFDYTNKESYQSCLELFSDLKTQGLNPVTIALDGNTNAIRAVLQTFPKIKVQRCLYHIQRQGLSWLRMKPKSDLGKQLKFLFLKVSSINTVEDKRLFINEFIHILTRYKSEIGRLDNKDKVESDILRAISLIKNAYTNMFHYLENKNIPKTSNRIEGYFSNLKTSYRKHRGIKQENRANYLHWYLYLKNKSKIKQN